MEKSNSFRDLVAWQKSKMLSVKVYQLTVGFPKTETFGLTSQIRRASISVALNIAEGQGRNTVGEFKQFLGIAKGSLAELETIIEICQELKFFSMSESNSLLVDCAEIQKLINGLLKYLKSSSKN